MFSQVFRKFKKQKKRLKKRLLLASLDLSNAFGSLPQWVIFEALRRAGAGEELISIIKNLYWEAATSYKTSAGLSTPRVATNGVRQGDPFSGVLFILTIDFILRNIQKMGSCRDPSNRGIFHYILAYADDMLVLAKDVRTLQALLHQINKLAVKIGLKFNNN